MKLKHLLISAFMLLSAGTAWADVRINSINFSDANFRSYLTSQSYGSDGLLSDAEIAQIKSLMLSSKSIQNLNGIKNFTALQYLTCDGNQLTSLDVSGCESLIELDCSNNQLTSLNVSGCSALTSIICAQNQLKGDAMDDLIAGLPTTQDGGLYVINVKSDGNTMTIDQVQSAKAKGWTAYALDGSWSEYAGVNININAVCFPDEQFRSWLLSQSYGSDGFLTDKEIAKVTSIDVALKSIQSLQGIEYFTALTSLRCSSNQLTSLDVSKNTKLDYLRCSSNQLTSLDVSKNTALTSLDCGDNQLTSLDVSKNTKLDDLRCSSNQLTSLDVSKNTKLDDLSCSSNQLTSLDVSKNTKLTGLDCGDNQLTSLDVSKNTKLTGLDCGDNQLTSLDVSKNISLGALRCSGNQFTSLDVSKNTELWGLYCNNNQLTSLNVSKNTALQWLHCSGNQLTSLDVSKNISLGVLFCEKNQLTSLDVSKNTELTELHCNNNQLTSLDVSKNRELEKLYCYQNQIKGAAMDALVASLRASNYNYTMRVIYYENEQNVMTTTQVAAAKAKKWTPYYTEDGTKWKEYSGVDPSTGVNNVETADADDSAPWYTINGTLLSGKPTEKGIYIHNGKKVIVK